MNPLSTEECQNGYTELSKTELVKRARIFAKTAYGDFTIIFLEKARAHCLLKCIVTVTRK